MNVLSLFAGIGGFDLGLESTGGFRTIAFCEIEPYPRAVLAARWPGIPCYPDIRELTGDRLQADGLVRPDLICGGFPCQDISSAGGGAGLDGERSKLWWEMHRLIAECRPRWVIAENSPSLRGRGADRVLGSLESLGYACWPLVVGAVHAGAWHRRQRVWILAQLDGVRELEPAEGGNQERLWAAVVGQPHADADSQRREGPESAGTSPCLRRRSADTFVACVTSADAHREHGWRQQLIGSGSGWGSWNEPDWCDQTPADSDGFDADGRGYGPSAVRRGRSAPPPILGRAPADVDGPELREPKQWVSGRRAGGVCDQGFAFARDDGAIGDSTDAPLAGLEVARPGEGCAQSPSTVGNAGRPVVSDLVRMVHGVSDGLDEAAGLEAAEALAWWPLTEEPPIPRTARDVPHRVERIAALGNAVVPEVAAMIGRAILSVEATLA